MGQTLQIGEKTGWATAVRQRRRALLIRLCVGAATGLIISPLLGYAFSLPWVAAYFAMQLLETAIFSPIISRRTETLPVWRSALGGLILFLNTGMIGGLSVPLWLTGGAMGGICAGVLLPAVLVYSVVNAPRSGLVLALTIAPQLIFMAMTPAFMTANGATPAYATAAGAALVVFVAFCLTTWQRMNQASIAESRARIEAEQRCDAAERAMAGRAAFLAAVAHDLRTPIGAILTGAAEIGSDADGSARGQAALIADAGQMMKGLLDDLLDHSRLEAGRMSVEATDVDLRALMAQTARLWRGPALAKGLRLTIVGGHSLPASVRGDAMRIRQVLNNLMSNALKFTQDGGITIRLNAWREDSGDHAVTIEVADTGPGMTRDQLDRLFTAFDQTADGVGARFGGSGLGLAISRELAQLMGGRLTVRSQPGQGARFTLSLTLPEGSGRPVPAIDDTGLDQASRGAIARALADRAAAPTPPAPEPLAPAATLAPAPEAAALEPSVQAADETQAEDEGRPLSILVVDDHDINRRAIQLILQPLGCEIATAADGLQALAACEARAFDVIFMDVRMPELDGRETTRRLRAGAGPNARTPVIAVTADTQPEDVEACRAAGMAYFVSKPLTPAALIGALQHVLSDAQAADEASPEIVAA
ncbi:MAG: response regulator [Brevundimonas sp.]|uniref:ATP-binding protein n=1 Tax=Brevundimonas sp. TaxID=1871086 RepID=UPI0025C18662|nr:ATP-binding protein [Brevundimonas sp.]MBX3478088.1 response regulator [Brevundimonas sp.]